ncbi:MAG: N-acetyl-gamma-glutamyl-phosphate reductase [Verrucomicrobiota bacterium]|nr:N-acetyl-gamma-glutamyl-phosphate reductase [Verrucomicrobiota bacterium]
MAERKVNVAIVGASGYSGEELVRLLLGHPHANLSVLTSRQYVGQLMTAVFPRFAGYSEAKDLIFSEPSIDVIVENAEVVFLALPHGTASEFAIPLAEKGVIVIDLSADFRINDAAVYKDYYEKEHPEPEWLTKAVYGMPEIYRSNIAQAELIASPGCYPTSILIPTIPLIRSKLIDTTEIIANSMSGVSGAGRNASLPFLFAECNESLRPYSVPKHRHLSEIEQELELANGTPVTIEFTPHLVPVNRGILTTLYLKPPTEQTNDFTHWITSVEECLQNFYANEPFVRIIGDKRLPDTKNVTNTNTIEIGWAADPRTQRLRVFSAEDNLVKGASGQAVQSFNIRFGFEETTGLQI